MNPQETNGNHPLEKYDISTQTYQDQSRYIFQDWVVSKKYYRYFNDHPLLVSLWMVQINDSTIIMPLNMIHMKKTQLSSQTIIDYSKVKIKAQIIALVC